MNGPLIDSKPRSYRPYLILLYAQDQRGLGHINRTLTIARHLLAAWPRAVAYIATRSPINNGFVLPERCDYIKLASRLVPEGFPHDIDDKRQFRRARRPMLREATECLSPDLVIVDHEPLGMNAEFREGLYALKEMRPDAAVVFGLRTSWTTRSASGRSGGRWEPTTRSATCSTASRSTAR